jgi:hypothetical protein
MIVGRRRLLHLIGAAGLVVRCAPTASASGFLSADEKSALGALANAVIPPDADPGGEALGAVDYIERLVTTFDAHVPALFGGGPFSGRQQQPDANGHPSSTLPPNDFTNFVELDRVSEYVWRLKLHGSAGVPGGAPNESMLGPVIGIRDQLKKGLAAAMAASKAPLAKLSPADLADTFNALDKDFRDLMIDLVIEAAFSAPEYGGNKNLEGWRLTHYDGDSQPLGYSQWDGAHYVERPDAPVSTANPGPDPAPMDAATRQVLETAIAFLGGRVNP